MTTTHDPQTVELAKSLSVRKVDRVRHELAKLQRQRAELNQR